MSSKERSFSLEERHIGWGEYTTKICALETLIIKSGTKINYIYGVPRGGLIPAVYASHLLGKIPMYSIRASRREWNEFHIQEIVREKLKTVKNVLIVDEISDSGEVVLLLKEYFKKEYLDLNTKFAVVYTKEKCLDAVDYYSEIVDDRWLVFPYEKD